MIRSYASISRANVDQFVNALRQRGLVVTYQFDARERLYRTTPCAIGNDLFHEALYLVGARWDGGAR